MKSILAILAALISLISAHKNQTALADACSMRLYAMGSVVVSVEVSDGEDLVTVENCNGQQYAFYAPCYDFYVGDGVSCVMSDMGTTSVLDDVVVSACYDRYDLLS